MALLRAARGQVNFGHSEQIQITRLWDEGRQEQAVAFQCIKLNGRSDHGGAAQIPNVRIECCRMPDGDGGTPVRRDGWGRCRVARGNPDVGIAPETRGERGGYRVGASAEVAGKRSKK